MACVYVIIDVSVNIYIGVTYYDVSVILVFVGII